MKTKLPAFLFFSLLFSALYVSAQDACTEIYQKSCQEDIVHLDEGTNILSLQDLAAQGRQIVPEVKSELAQFIRRRVSSPILRRGMIDRIDGVTVEINENTGSMSYNPETHVVTMGMRFFQENGGQGRANPSLFSFIQALTHELTHSIDPCLIEIAVGTDGRFPPLKNTDQLSLVQAIRAYPISSLTCLASPQSVGIGDNTSRIQNDPHAEHADRYPGKPLCQKTRLNESLCDYAAAEILNVFIEKKFQNLSRQQIINGLANVYAVNCHAKNEPSNGGSTFHPNAATRVAWILLAQKDIRAKLTCEPTSMAKQYCR